MDLILAIAVVLFIVVAEVLRRRNVLKAIYARKILHIGAITVSAFSVYVFEDSSVLFLIVSIAVPLLCIAVGLGFFKDPGSGRPSFGIIYFSVVFWILLALFGDDSPELVYYPLLVLAWSDGLATVFGHRFAKSTWPFSDEAKSPLGTAVFAVIGFFVLVFGDSFLKGAGLETAYSVPILLALFLSIFPAMVEALSVRGLDNIWIPFGVAYWLLLGPDLDKAYWLTMLIVLPALGYFSYAKRWLTGGGAFAAVLIGWVLTLNPEPIWIIPALVFFLVGSILSKLPGDKDNSSVRDANQVFANGGIPVIFLMAYYVVDMNEALIASVSGFAFALSDTSASEIGIRYGKRHINLRTFRRAERGLSGVVSFVGTLAGLALALVMGVIYYLLSGDVIGSYVVASAGFIGNLTDTLVGDLLQGKYLDPSGSYTEERGSHRSKAVSGFGWVTNNVTNAISSFVACLLGLLISILI